MISIQRTVAAEPDRVWALLSDLDRWADRLPTVTAITRVDAGAEARHAGQRPTAAAAPAPITVGARFRVQQPGLATATYEVTYWQPNRAFSWAANSPGVQTVATHTVHPAGSGSKLTLGLTWRGPLAWLVRPFFTGKTRRFLAVEADTFARLAESQRSAPAGP